MKTATTQAQTDRSNHRSTSTGKFIKNPCECCGRGAPMTDYYSDVRDGAQFIVLDKRCAQRLGELSDDDFRAFVAFVAELQSW